MLGYTLLEVAGLIGSMFTFAQKNALRTQEYLQDKSLAEVTKLTRVEPLTIVSRDLTRRAGEVLPDINQACLSMFAGYYLQAVNILSKVKDVEVIKILDKLNPNRDSTGFMEEMKLRMAGEDIATLHVDNYKFNLPTRQSLSLESKDGKSDANIQLLNDISNLSVGKMLNVQICYNVDATKTDQNGQVTNTREERTVTVPVNVRLLVSLLDAKQIVNVLASKVEDISLSERYHKWRSGRISFIKDFIFCKDLIKEHKKALLNDDTGTVAEIQRRVTNGKTFGLMTQNPSLATATNIFIITKEEADQIGKTLMGRFSEPRVLAKVYENTYAMIIVVVDVEYERCMFYVNGVEGHSDLSYKEIKNSNKGRGPDIMEIMKAMQFGHAPQHF